MNNNLEFENEDLSPDSIEDNHSRTNYGEGFSKQETLEEAAINFYREFPSNPLDKPEWHYNRDVDCFKKRKAFINGAKYMAERMYSEEEVKEIIKLSCEEGMFIQRTINDKVNIPYTRIKDFTIKMFEQFKKK